MEISKTNTKVFGETEREEHYTLCFTAGDGVVNASGLTHEDLIALNKFLSEYLAEE